MRIERCQRRERYAREYYEQHEKRIVFPSLKVAFHLEVSVRTNRCNASSCLYCENNSIEDNEQQNGRLGPSTFSYQYDMVFVTLLSLVLNSNEATDTDN